MTPPIKIGSVASVVIVAAAVVLYFMARENDPENYRASIAQVQQIQQLASDWSVETARVRSDPMADYDALVAFVPQMDQLKETLLATVKGIPEIPDRLANDVSAYASAVDAKEERIERFKTANSVVRNSARYLPLAAASIVQDEASAADLAREVGNVATDINDYLAAPTDAAKGRLTAVVERLGTQAAGLPDRLANAVANFNAHATVLLEHQGPTDEIFEQATSNDLSDLSVRLIADLGTELNRVQQRSTWFMNGILGAAATLLLLWVVLALVRTRPDEVEVADADVALPDTLEAAPTAPVAATGVARDNGAAREAAASEKLLTAQRILAETIGQRIADTSHAIAADVETLPVENGAADEVRRRAQEIAELAERMARVSKAQDATYVLLDVNECLDEIVDSTSAEAVATVTRETAEVPEVFAARAEICLMLEKILENSVQAIQEKGLGQEGAKGEIRITTDGDDDKATVTVIDNGVGMAADVRERMFEPFYTSKADRAGLGLTTTSHLVEKYGGTFSVSSHEGGGTVTRVELPGMSSR
ncbi:MAG: ATP-binding protein [Gammaproteobacteria bacterium]|nr:ATP-binding protein [Gammaproteobacteria bacterium]